MTIYRDDYPKAGDIVIFQPEFVEFGGEERVILSLSKALYESGKSHTILCYWDKIDLPSFADWPLKVLQLNPAKNPVFKVISLIKCLQYLEKIGSPTPVLFNIQSAYHAGFGFKLRYHIRIPDTYRLLGFEEQKRRSVDSALRRYSGLFRGWVREVFTRRGIRHAQRFVTNTIVLRDEMSALYGRNAQVIYLGGQGGVRNDLEKVISKGIELLTVCRLQKSKRIDWIIRGLALLKDDFEGMPEWQLNIVGAGPEENSLKALCHELDIDDRVIFHGFVTDYRLEELYETSHIFLMPAIQGYGLPAIEALYRKLGLVISDESGVIEILRDNNWIIISKGCEADFSRAMKEMLLRVTSSEFYAQQLPDLPTQGSWAKEVIKCFGW